MKWLVVALTAIAPPLACAANADAVLEGISIALTDLRPSDGKVPAAVADDDKNGKRWNTDGQSLGACPSDQSCFWYDHGYDVGRWEITPYTSLVLSGRIRIAASGVAGEAAHAYAGVQLYGFIANKMEPPAAPLQWQVGQQSAASTAFSNELSTPFSLTFTNNTPHKAYVAYAYRVGYSYTSLSRSNAAAGPSAR